MNTSNLTNKRSYSLLRKAFTGHRLGIFFLLISFNTQAQSGSVTGKVSSGEGPLAEASVGIAALGIGTYTTADGTFVLNNVPEGTHLLEVSLLGYLPYRDSIRVSGTPVSMEIRLSPGQITLEGVTVIDVQTGLDSRTPYTVSRVDARKPETTGMPGGLGSLARRDPSVYGAEMGQGIVKPFIRGLGFSRVVTVYQGAKLENRQWGADHGLGLNDLGVSHLDVIKGPASVLYGSGAVGGVLLVHDHEPYRQAGKWTGAAGMTFNSVSLGYRPTFSFGRSFDNGFFVGADAAVESHADYLDGNRRIIGNSRFGSENIRLHAGFDRPGFKSKLSYTYLLQDLGIIDDNEMDDTETLATSRADRSMQLPFQQVRDHMVSYNQTTEHGRINTALQFSWHMNDREEIEDALDEIDLGLVQHHIFYNARIAHATTEKWRNTLGLQGSVLDERNKEEAKEILVPDARFIETGLYYMSDLELGKTFLQAGLRYDFRNIRGDARAPHLIDYGFVLPGNPADRRLSRNFSGFTGSLGASHKIGEGHTLKANFSTGFRAPDLAELFSNGPHPGTNRFEIGDADFGREQSLQVDLGYNFMGERFDFSVSAYSTLIENYIFFAATGELRDDGLEIWAFDQTDGLLYGGEFSAAYMPFGDDRLTLSAAAHIIRGEDLSSDENLTFVPPDQLMFRIGGRPLADDATALFLRGRYAALQNRPGPGEASTPAYFLLDAGAERSFPMGSTVFTAGISVFNTLNAVYVDHMSILRAFNVTHPGRNIAVNLRLNF